MHLLRGVCAPHLSSSPRVAASWTQLVASFQELCGSSLNSHAHSSYVRPKVRSQTGPASAFASHGPTTLMPIFAGGTSFDLTDGYP